MSIPITPDFHHGLLVGCMYAALPIGWTVSHLMMGVVYFAVVMPIGLVSRLVRGGALHRRPDRAARSYWIERPQSKPGVVSRGAC